MSFDLLSIIGIVTAFQLLLLAVFLVNHKKPNHLSNQILSVFMFSEALLVGNFVLQHLGVFTFGKFPHTIFIS